jgi:hypothetical protein
MHMVLIIAISIFYCGRWTISGFLDRVTLLSIRT